MSAFAISFLHWGVVLGLIQVESSTSCPSAAEVSAEVSRLRAEPGVSPARPSAAAVVRLESRVGTLRLELRAAGGTVLARRELAAAASCPALARAAAVVVSIWERELESGINLPLDIALGASPPSVGPGYTYDVGASFVGSFAGTVFAPGGGLDGYFGSRRTGFGAHAAFTAAVDRAQSVGPGGQVSWRRLGGSVGGRYRWTWRRALVDAHGDLLLAGVFAEGSNFSVNRADSAFDPGLGAGVRAGLRLGPALPFVDVGVAGWPRRQEPQVLGLSAAATGPLPRFELLLRVGISLGKY